METVIETITENGISVVLSSHELVELERVADYLIVLARGQMQVPGEVADLLAEHRVLTGPAGQRATPRSGCASCTAAATVRNRACGSGRRS